MRRVRDLARPAAYGEQGELFPTKRHHPFFTGSPFESPQAARHHRHHAVIEQVMDFADGSDGSARARLVGRISPVRLSVQV